jgi:HAD superfamily hydrolase (TIGR01549 family)
MTSRLRAVTFDLDGTLYDDHAARRRLLWATFPYWRTLRVGRRVREELRARTFDSGEAFLVEEARVVAERLERDVAATRTLLRELFDVRLARVLARTGPRADARTTIASLAERGLRLAIVSDRGAVDDKLRALGLHDLPWSAHVSADDTGALKPQARAFQTALERLGVAPGEVLHVGDRDDTDGVGARAAGCHVAILGTEALPMLGAVPRIAALL